VSAARAWAAFVLLPLALGACADPLVGEAAGNVLTLQTGTMTELRGRRGQGPFRAYDVPPREMVEVLGEAVRKARGLGGEPVTAIWVKPRRGEVYAKERTADLAADDFYDGPFRTAMIAFVHPVPGRPDASRVEIHAITRGPFHGGAVQWERDMPGWIDEALSERIDPLP
jgi:hypothetical protein